VWLGTFLGTAGLRVRVRGLTLNPEAVTGVGVGVREAGCDLLFTINPSSTAIAVLAVP